MLIENLTRHELLRRIYDDPGQYQILVGDIPLGLAAAADLIYFAGMMRHGVARLISPELRWSSSLGTLHSITTAIIEGQRHPLLDDWQAAITANASNRPLPTVQEREARILITDIVLALSRQPRQSVVNIRRRSSRTGGGGQIGLGAARMLVADHLRHNGHQVTVDQLRAWSRTINGWASKLSGDGRLAFQKRRATMQGHYFAMGREEALAAAVNQMNYAQPFAALAARNR